MMVPPIVTLIPTYLLFSDYHLVGTYWPWVLWGAAGTPYAIFLYRQFFSSFPKELEEAAVIDGAGPLRIFIQVFLPLSRPLLVTAFVLGFNAVWGDFIGPDLFLNQSTAPPFETKLQFNAVPMYGLWYVTPDIDRIAAMVATAGGRITSVLADDQALIRAGFRVLIEVAGDIEVVGEAVNGEQAVDLARRERADVVLMDIRMPGVDGLEATRRIAADEDLAGVKVIILTTFESDEYVYQASGP
jgi:CheY-like chemotaxis protein